MIIGDQDIVYAKLQSLADGAAIASDELWGWGMGKNTSEFRKRLNSGKQIVGTFVKTPSPIVTEVLSRSTLDVYCIDTEHAPFGRLELYLCIAAFRAADCPCLVRVASDSPAEIRNALDSGASGILVPHVTSAEQAASVVKAAHFGEGGRGYSGSSRAAEFTTKSMQDHITHSNEQTVVLLQIEDLAALDKVADIVAVDGVDGLFIGRADLAVAMSKSISDPDVIAAIGKICEEGSRARAIVGMFTPDLAELPKWRTAGASLFLLSSDQGFMLDGANKLAERVRL